MDIVAGLRGDAHDHPKTASWVLSIDGAEPGPTHCPLRSTIPPSAGGAPEIYLMSPELPAPIGWSSSSLRLLKRGILQDIPDGGLCAVGITGGDRVGNDDVDAFPLPERLGGKPIDPLDQVEM